MVLHVEVNFPRIIFEAWISNWKKNGWKTSQRKPVLNQDLWMRLDTLILSVKGTQPKHAAIECKS